MWERLDDDVWYKSVPLDVIIKKLDTIAGRAAHFVVFDACRNVLKTKGKGKTDKGFVAMPERRGMLIAFSTDPGSTASDAGRGSGPYATALAEQIVKPGLNHLILFQNVKEQVFRQTRGQLPWTRDGLTSRVYLNGEMTAEDRRQARAKARWLKIRKARDPDKLEALAVEYDGTVYADAARTLAETLRTVPQNLKEDRSSTPLSRQTAVVDGEDALEAPRPKTKPPKGMVLIPAGQFSMGCVRGDKDCSDDEKPRHEVYLDAYYIDRTEVTVSAYRKCSSCEAPKRGDLCNWGRKGREQHPVNCVDWTQAKAYCESMGKRLPTEAEWERAARGDPKHIYPWGNERPSAARAVYGKSYDHDTVEVCSKGEAGHGLCDMAGNVWEWVADCYKPYERSDKVTTNPLVQCSSGGRVLRGGSFGYAASWLRASSRYGSEPGDRSWHFGFRCVAPASR